MSPAGIVDGNADAVGIEDPVLRALGTNGFVPDMASRVSNDCIVSWRIDTSSIHKVISSIAGDALSKVVKGSAGVLNRDADSKIIEDPSCRAFQANSILPSAASWVAYRGSIGAREHTGSVDQVVSSVAGETESIGSVPSPALGINLLANSISIEVGSFSAGLASVRGPRVAEGVGVNIV